MKIVTVIGARPQFIKAAMVSKHLRKHHEEYLVHTGQHFDYNMSRVFFEEMGLPKPNINLEIREVKNTLQVAKMMMKLTSVYEKQKPDLILVYGDTNSTLAGALSARQHNIPVAHIEAGLRSHDLTMPEEQNRILTDRISEVLFCPTDAAVNELKKEGITDGVEKVGDVMHDAALYFKEKATKTFDLEKIGVEKKKYILLTLHRAANVDNPKKLQTILNAISKSKHPVVFPIHPRTKKNIEKFGLGNIINKTNGKIISINPASYLEMLALEQHALKIVTDSGGVQKEAYFFKIPCITLRPVTEWVETVKSGWNILVGSDPDKISDAISNFSPTTEPKNYYGDGRSGEKIVSIISRISKKDAETNQELTQQKQQETQQELNGGE